MNFALLRPLFLSGLLALLSACLNRPAAPIQPSSASALPDSSVGRQAFPFQDDGDKDSLKRAVDYSLGYYRARPATTSYRLGGETFSAAHMAASLEAFLRLLDLPPEEFNARFNELFWVFESSGAAGSVVFSSYYEHALDASLSRDAVFRFPLYGPPSDLVMSPDPERPGERRAMRRRGGGLVPYYTRREIDSDGALQGRGLEIAWAKDPLEIYFLQVEGSGWLRLPDGRQLRIRYAANNGHRFYAIGQYMIEQGLVPRPAFNRAAMISYMQAHPDQRQEILNSNARYVFFRLDRSSRSHETHGSLRVPLTAGRSVAVDPAVFPPGALGWMDAPGEPPIRRFIVAQDEGGAIKGPGRVDYFIGAGEQAADFASRFWRKGRLFFFVLKREAVP